MEWFKNGLCRHLLRLVRVVAQHHHLSSQAPREKQDLSALLSSRAVLSAESRERCVARINKMKSMRPGVDVDVKRRAAVLGECQYFVMSGPP